MEVLSALSRRIHFGKLTPNPLPFQFSLVQQLTLDRLLLCVGVGRNVRLRVQIPR